MICLRSVVKHLNPFLTRHSHSIVPVGSNNRIRIPVRSTSDNRNLHSRLCGFLVVISVVTINCSQETDSFHGVDTRDIVCCQSDCRWRFAVENVSCIFAADVVSRTRSENLLHIHLDAVARANRGNGRKSGESLRQPVSLGESLQLCRHRWKWGLLGDAVEVLLEVGGGAGEGAWAEERRGVAAVAIRAAALRGVNQRVVVLAHSAGVTRGGVGDTDGSDGVGRVVARKTVLTVVGRVHSSDELAPATGADVEDLLELELLLNSSRAHCGVEC